MNLARLHQRAPYLSLCGANPRTQLTSISHCQRLRMSHQRTDTSRSGSPFDGRRACSVEGQ